ncbi:MAG: DUF3068 domain-containing protein [Marmoricola sp.]
MRKTGMFLSLLGGFLIVLGLMATFYAPARLMKTPLDTDSTTRLSGRAQLQAAAGLEKFPVKAVSITRADTKKSDGNVIVFVNSSCLVRDEGNPPNCVGNDDPAKRLISAGVDTFATNRKTAMAVNDPKYLPAEAGKHEGLINKWPFQSKKQTYPYWDDLTGSTHDAKYSGTTKLDGLTVYKYDVTIQSAPIQIAQGVPGTYNDQKTIYIEPLTGAIMHQVDKQSRLTDAGAPVLDLSLSFTSQQVAKNVKDAKANVSQLNLVRKVIPLVGLIGGVLALAAGLVLSRRGHDSSHVARDDADLDRGSVSLKKA